MSRPLLTPPVAYVFLPCLTVVICQCINTIGITVREFTLEKIMLPYGQLALLALIFGLVLAITLADRWAPPRS
jgi:hypothetical protein